MNLFQNFCLHACLLEQKLFKALCCDPLHVGGSHLAKCLAYFSGLLPLTIFSLKSLQKVLNLFTHVHFYSFSYLYVSKPEDKTMQFIIIIPSKWAKNYIREVATLSGGPQSVWDYFKPTPNTIVVYRGLIWSLATTAIVAMTPVK